MNRIKYALAIGSFAGLFLSWLFLDGIRSTDESHGVSSVGTGIPSSTLATSEALPLHDGETKPGQHPMAGQLGRPGFPPENEPVVVHDMLQAWRRIEGRFPVAEDNAGLVRQLTEGRSGRSALIGKNHQRINAQGELMDGWGTPYFFHHISGDYLEIRSAGLDHRMYTEDDIIVPPPRPVKPAP